jgi:hypothetical protein
MSQKQCDSSSDLESPDVMERTPVKEDNNETVVRGLLASKQTQCDTSLSHSTPRCVRNESKSHPTLKEYHSQKAKKLGMTAGKYGNCKFMSSDSEISSFNEDSPSASDSSSPVTTPDENDAVGAALREAESSSANGRPVLETSISGKVIVEHRAFKSPVHSVVDYSDTLVKTVEDDDNDSSVQTNEVSWLIQNCEAFDKKEKSKGRRTKTLEQLAVERRGSHRIN